MAYSPRLVANAFLVKAKEAGVPVSHMKLQKLVFFLHAWTLALREAGSLVDGKPEAWPYGPVFDGLYHELKSYGASNIGAYLTELNPATGQMAAMVPSRADTEFYQFLDQVWDRYGGFSALQLSALSHEAGGPWAQARANHAKLIDDEVIRDYYRGKLAQ